MATILRISLDRQARDASRVEELLRELTDKKQNEAMAALLAGVQEAKRLSTAVSIAKRSLMGFDQINRLAAKSGKSTQTAETPLSKLEALLSQEDGLRNVVLKLYQDVGLLEDGLAETSTVTQSIRESFTAAGFAGDYLSRILEQTKQTVVNALSGFTGLQDRLRGVSGSFYSSAQASGAAAEEIKGSWFGLGEWVWSAASDPLKGLWSDLPYKAKTSAEGVRSVFSDLGTGFSDTFSDAWVRIRNAFSDGGDVFVGVTGGVLTGFKKIVNGLIGGINQTVLSPFTGINDALNKLKNVTVGSISPFKNLNFSISTPQIPFLASGAVLPANKPFLAMVGDQKHGTNIEAPLETIQQAVAAVMAENLEAELAGHSATVEVLRQILEAVLGISLDEGTVTRAVERHQRKVAVMTGGF